MKKTSFLPTAAVLASLFVAHPARPDALDDILSKVLYLIDPGLPPAQPVIRCVIQGGSVSSCTQTLAKTQAAAAAANNPKLMTAVNVVKAIQKQDWITVLDVAGTDLLFKLACSAGLPPGGPVKEFLCSSITSQLTKLAQPVLRDILVAVRDGNFGALFTKLLTSLGPSVACNVSIIPAEIRVPACTGIDLVLKGGLAAFKAMIDGLGDEVNGILSLGNKLLGSDVQKLTPKQYFAALWAPYLAKAAGLKITHADQPYSQLLSTLTNGCSNYYGTSAPCDAMRSVFAKAVTQSVAALQALEQPYYDANVKPGLFYNYLYYVGSKGVSNGGVGNCQPALYKQLPLPSGETADSEANPNPWANACLGVEAILKADLEKNKTVLLLESEAVLKKGCSITTNGGFYCPNYAGNAACLKLLPKHPSSCVLDQEKAAIALADEVLGKLGPKRCAAQGAVGWEHEIILCTRPWKTQTCQSLVDAATPAGVNSKVLCKGKFDPAFQQGEEKVRQVVQILNSGKTGVATPGGGPSLLVQGKPYTFKPAGCAPSPHDPLKIGCASWPVVDDVASKVPFLNLPTCAGDPGGDGADAPCYAKVFGVMKGP